VKRFLAFSLILLLTGCFPAVTATHARLNGDVTVTVESRRGLFDAHVIVLNASTEDERCGVSDDGSDLLCVIGDVPAGESVTILVRSDGLVYCVAYGHVSDELGLLTYRAFACAAR
jgi:hypothetical protein